MGVGVAEENVLNRIAELVGIGGHITERNRVSNEISGRVYMGAVGVAASVYGAGSSQAVAVKDASARILLAELDENSESASVATSVSRRPESARTAPRPPASRDSPRWRRSSGVRFIAAYFGSSLGLCVLLLSFWFVAQGDSTTDAVLNGTTLMLFAVAVPAFFLGVLFLPGLLRWFYEWTVETCVALRDERTLLTQRIRWRVTTAAVLMAMTVPAFLGVEAAIHASRPGRHRDAPQLTSRVEVRQVSVSDREPLRIVPPLHEGGKS
jgi:hypothetical protein